MARQREDWIDAARGVALSAVVFHHVLAYQANSSALAPSFLRQIDLALDGFRMPTLVAISGVLAAGVSEWPWREVWRRRAAPLLLLYGVWAVIGTVALAALTDRESARTAAERLAWIALRPDVWTWYLAALAIFLVAARALRAVPTAVLVPIAAAVFLVALYTWPDDLVGSLKWWWYVGEHWVFFVCAERFARGYRRAGTRATTPRALAALAAFALVALVAITAGVVTSPPVIGVLAITGTWLALCCAGAWGSAGWLAWARAIGRRSLGVYAIHSWFALILWYHVQSFVPAFPGDGVVAPVAFTAAVLAATYGITLALERWAPVPLLRPWWDTKARDGESRTNVAAPAQ